MEIKIAPNYKPHEKQVKFHRSNARYRVCAAGVRGGKTISATVEMLCSIYRDLAAGKGKTPAGHGRRRQPRLLYWVVAPTVPLNVHVHRYVHAFCPPELIERSYDDAIWLKPDILIEFKSAERPDLLVGASVNGILIDEACRVKADAWDGALRGRIADTGGWVILASSPIGGRNNWVFQRFVAQHGMHDIESFSWRTIDNTAVPELTLEVEQARASMPEAWFKREFEASFDSFGGAIYDEFNDDSHVISESAFRLEFGLGNAPFTPELMQRVFRRVVAGVDWGWTSPGAIVVVGQINDTQMVVLEESYEPNQRITGDGTTWVSEAMRLKRKWGISLFTCDSENPHAVNDFNINGLSAMNAWKDVYLGIRRVAEGLHVVGKKPGLRILDTCVNVRREIRSYQWRSNRDQSNFMDEPAGNQSDHSLDALRYAVVELRPYVANQHAVEPNRRGRTYGMMR